MNPVTKYLAVTALILSVLLGSAYFGWTVRGLVCKNEMATYQQQLATQAEQQREASRQIEVKQAAATDQSSERIDHQQAEQQKETVYVEKQVIQYHDRWRDRPCQRPAEWVRLYNASLFGTDPTVSTTGPAGSPPAGPGL